MARSFLTPITLNQNEIQNARIQNLASAPSTPVAGQFYYDTVANYTLIWNGTIWVDARARANHSGTQLSATISDLASTVQGYRLNQFAAPNANLPMAGFQITGLATSQTATGQAASWDFVVGRNLNTIASAAATTANIAMSGFKFTGLGTPAGAGDSAEYSWVLARSLSAFAAPTADLAMGSHKITGLSAPTIAGDAAEYAWVIGQVQSAAAGIASKSPVECVATANITLSGLQTIDGYTTLVGDRILVAGQTTASANGTYNAASGAWTRTTIDGAAPGEIETGALWMIQNGSVYAGSQWRVATQTSPIVVGTTALSIVQFSAASLYSGGNGITLTGTVFSVNPAASGGITVAAGGVSIDSTIVPKKYSSTIGDGSSTSIIVTHSLGTQDVMLICRQAGSPFAVVECDMQATSTTTATFAFAAAPAASAYRVTVIG